MAEESEVSYGNKKRSLSQITQSRYYRSHYPSD